jgi:indole-3-glycerol phosphate synthase
VSTVFLEEMAAGSRARLAAAKAVRSEGALVEQARRSPVPPPLRLDSSGFDLIAELKLRSPAAGALDERHESAAQRVVSYARAGAAAVSVLTEPARFAGSLAHLSEAAAALAPLAVPAMRKDFLVDPYQVLEARVAGAAGVLVIVRMLPRATIVELLDAARELGLFVLLEAFDARDLELMHELIGAHAPSQQLLAGLNCRDLTTLEVLPERLFELAPQLPRSVPRVAESGVAAPAEAGRVAAAGYELALVGSALMRAADPGALARALLSAGRAARGAC